MHIQIYPKMAAYKCTEERANSRYRDFFEAHQFVRSNFQMKIPTGGNEGQEIGQPKELVGTDT